MATRTVESIALAVYKKVNNDHGGDVAYWVTIDLYWEIRASFHTSLAASTDEIIR